MGELVEMSIFVLCDIYMLFYCGYFKLCNYYCGYCLFYKYVCNDKKCDEVVLWCMVDYLFFLGMLLNVMIMFYGEVLCLCYYMVVLVEISCYFYVQVVGI